MSRLLLLLVPLALLGCPAKEASKPAPTPDDGGGGAGGSGAIECADHASGSACDAEDEGAPGACAYGEICGVVERSCAGGERCCSLRRSCQPQVGELPGGARCEQDVDCMTGLCFSPRFGTSVCLRSCDPSDGAGCPDGMHCALVELGAGATTPTCLGGSADEPDLDRTVCRSNSDCAEGRRCHLQVAEGGFAAGVPIGVCDPRPDGLTPDAGKLCGLPTETLPARAYGTRASSADCEEYGLCATQCRVNDAVPCECGDELQAGTCLSNRCATPCRIDDDCAPREICGSFVYGADDYERSEHRFRVCQLPIDVPPEWGCRDELDCCKGGLQRNGRSCCARLDDDGVRCRYGFAETTVCRPQEFPPGSGRAVSLCRVPGEGLGLVGAPCSVAADCATDLCVPDGAGGRVCSSPCEAAHDRCDAMLPGSRCCATAVDGGLCLEGCRFDCTDAQDCTVR